MRGFAAHRKRKRNMWAASPPHTPPNVSVRDWHPSITYNPLPAEDTPPVCTFWIQTYEPVPPTLCTRSRFDQCFKHCAQRYRKGKPPCLRILPIRPKHSCFTSSHSE